MVMVAGADAGAATQITVYTSVSDAEARQISRRFAVPHPQIELRWVRDSVDAILGRLLIERQQPKADIAFGLPASVLAGLSESGYFQPYIPKGFDKLDRRFSDPGEPPRWIGLRAWAGALCVNPEALAAAKLKKPARWGDLLDPAYRERILGLDPRATRTGFMTISAWFALWGNAGGWRYMEGLHRNIAAYMSSGNGPCDQVARGTYPIGISYAYRAAKLRAKKQQVEIVLPGDGVGWDIEAVAIVAGTPYGTAARTFVDWTVSSDAAALLARGFGLSSQASIAKPPRFYPEKIKEQLVPVDFTAAAEDRDKVLAEWRLRFGAKAEPSR